MLLRFFSIFAIIILSLTLSNAGSAKSGIQRVSEHEKAICAFLELTNQPADLDAWIMNSEHYREANRFDKPLILEADKPRLENGCNAFDPKEDLIKIKQPIRVSTRANDQQQQTLEIRFVDKAKNQETHFSYKYAKHMIALIIEELNGFRKVALKPEEAPLVQKYFHNNAPHEAEIEIRVKAKSADGKSKIQLSGQQQWIMLGEIAYIKINVFDKFKDQDVVIWDHSAPWYYNESQKALLEMFRHPTP